MYAQFVPRDVVVSDVFDALRQQQPLVILSGLGGMGKTCIAREIADRCYQDSDSTVRFDYVVWVDGQGQQGATNLSVVLDEIARALEFPGIMQQAFREKQQAVKNLLARHRVLVVVDNADTVTDGALLPWLANLPAQSKAMVTTRDSSLRQTLSQRGRMIEVRGMTELEAKQLIAQHVQSLKIPHVETYEQFQPLIKATGGNPKAMVMALGLIKQQGLSIGSVVKTLESAGDKLFDDLFSRIWEKLIEPARRIVLALSLFPDDASRAALIATARVDEITFRQVVQQLIDLTMLDVVQVDLNNDGRYTMQPLVRSFARRCLSEQPNWAEAMRERWLDWTIETVQRVGWAWKTIQDLAMLQPEEKTIAAAIVSVVNRDDQRLLALARGIDHYYYVRGLWERKESLDRWRIAAAERLRDPVEEAQAIAQHVQFLCTRGRLDDQSVAAAHITRLRVVAQPHALKDHLSVLVQAQHAYAFFDLAWGAPEQAIDALMACRDYLPSISEHLSIATEHWIATAYYRSAQIETARQAFEAVLGRAIAAGYQRSSIYSRHYLARIALDEGDLERAKKLLDDGLQQAQMIQEQRYIAQINLTLARVHLRRGDSAVAQVFFADAEDLFNQLNLYPDRDMLEATRAELARVQ